MIKEEQDPHGRRRDTFLLFFLDKGSSKYPVGKNWVIIKQKSLRIICIAKTSCLLYRNSSNNTNALLIKYIYIFVLIEIYVMALSRGLLTRT